MAFLNMHDAAIDRLDLTPYQNNWCCVCGRPRQHGHHVVFRSHGGKDSHIVPLCAACHDKAHAHRLWFKALDGRLWALEVDEPCSIDTAYWGDGKWHDLLERQSAIKELNN